MNVLFVSEEFWPRQAGGEIWSWDLCRTLAKKHTVTVLTTRRKGSPRREVKENVTILRPVRAGNSLLTRRFVASRLAAKLRGYLRHTKPDIIHGMAYAASLQVSRIAKNRHIPCITSVHSYFGTAWKDLTLAWPIKWFLEREIIQKDQAQIMHVPSEYLQTKIRALGKKTVVVHNWLTTEKFPKPKKFKKRTLVFVGSLEPVKNPLACLDIINDEDLVLIGKGSLGERLTEEANRRGISYTWIPSLSREATLSYIGGASLLLIPSKEESFSLVALEALAQGTPVSGTPVGILPELNVYPFPPSRVPARLTRKEQLAIRKQFSREKSVQKIEKLYKKCLKTTKGFAKR